MDYYDDYYDNYDQQEELDQYDYDRYTNENWEAQTWHHTMEICIKPSVGQTFNYILILIGVNIACHILWNAVRYFKVVTAAYHLCSMLCGFLLLYLTTNYDFLIVLFLCLMAYILILLIDYGRYKHIGIIVSIVTISSHFIYELLWSHPEAWQRIRGMQMVATMKIISLAFDIEEKGCEESSNNRTPVNTKITHNPALIPYLGYIFCPATCVLGPWITYNCYEQSMQRVRLWDYRWICWLILNTVFAMVFLCLSNCIVPQLCPDSYWKWIVAFRDALTVRCSHYFISFLSQTTLAAAGLSASIVQEHSFLFGYMITKPWNIEFPRSLSSLVRSWNIPMHDWLKNYVFLALRQRYKSYAAALICTYIVSSLLHGFHFKIYLVLLSLSFFGYSEQVLRSKLANIFDACISANPCKKPCKYSNCPSHSPLQWRSSLAIWSFNFVFSLITLLNLTYLGIILNNPNTTSTEEQAGKFDIKGGLLKWSRLNFASHWIAVLTYIFYYLI